MSKIYSPSQTTNFLTCPMLWALQKQGWTPKTYSKMNVYGARGSAVSVGLDVFYKTASLEVTKKAIITSVDEEWEKNRLDSREWREFKSLPPKRSEIANMALNLVEAYILNPCTAFAVLHTEYVFKKHGYSRADIIGKLASGAIVPIDFKAKDVPYSEYLRYNIRDEYKYSHQMMHYVWATGEEFGIDCTEFGIVILWYSKVCKVEYLPFTVHPDRLLLWHRSAVQTWERMEAMENGEISVTEVAEHGNKFGPCAFAQACLVHNRDPKAMLSDYYQVTKKGK